MPQIITARRLITANEIIDFPVITLADDGTIARIDVDPTLQHHEETLCAASFDVHTHGGLGHDVMSASPEDFRELQRFYAARGVAHYLPTTVTASVDTTLRSLENIARLLKTPVGDDEAQPVGIHLEGPFLSHAKRGVHPTAELQEPSIELFDRFWEASEGRILLMTLAPELPGALDLLRHASSLGVRVSLGHSNATYQQAQALIDAGAASATHTFNAMRALDHREPGILTAVLNAPNLYAELIADGIHVAPEVARLWWRCKSPKHALLVTDSMSATGMPDGSYTLGGLPVTVANSHATLTESPQTLAGSVLTLRAAVENLQRFVGASLGEATYAASHAPAAMLGRPEVTGVAIGEYANLNRYNAEGRHLSTYLRGKELPAQ